MLARLDPGSASARRGLSDIAIRNLFIIPTIICLIVFNIFPLIYSLGYSFTDFRASTSAPANFIGLDNYRELLADPYIWTNFTITAKYVLVSVGGQVLVGFGVALLLNRKVPAKGLVTTLLLLPMMMSACSGNCSTAHRGESSITYWAWKISNGCPTPTSRCTPSRSPISGCGRRS
jgi:multiple sugar transport system permease protein